MYKSCYVFYRMQRNVDGVWAPCDVKVAEFSTPQQENTFIRAMRKNGYKTYRAPEDVWALLVAAGALYIDEPVE